MLSSCFRRGEGKEIAVEAVNSRVVRELRRKLYQKAKQEMRKPLEEDDRKAVFGKVRRGGLKTCRWKTCPGNSSFIQVAGSEATGGNSYS